MKHPKPVAHAIPKRCSSLCQIREAVNDLAKLREEMAKRRGARPLSDEQIRKAIHAGRR